MSPDPDPGRDDAALVEAHVAGDPAAFGALFARHRDRLWAVAVRTTGNPEDAADALQDAMISAFRRAEAFRGDSAVTTWLHRIVVNACLDRLRRAKVRSADPLPDDLEEHAARGTVLVTSTSQSNGQSDPEAHALAADLHQRVLAALAELPPDQKTALVLVDMEGYRVQEAARILDVPTGTIKSRCARGRARLAVLLADLEPAAAGPRSGGAVSGGAVSGGAVSGGAVSGGTPAGAGASHPGDPPGGGSALHPNDSREEVSGDE